VRRHRHPAIDYAGAALLTVTLASIVVLTDLGGLTYPWWSMPIAVLAAIAIAGLIGFVLVERRASEPILPMRLMCQPTFVFSILVALAAGFALFGSVTYLPLFLQVVKGSSPTASGLEMMPIMAGTLVSSIVSGQLISRYGRYRIFPILGTATATLGLLLLGGLEPDTPRLALIGYMLTLGLGLGMVTQVLVTVAQNTARSEDLGVTTSGVTLFRLIGGSLGTAILGTVFSSQIAGTIDGGAVNPAALTSAAPAALEAMRASITHGVGVVFRVAAGVAAVGFVFAWFIPERPLRRTVAAATADPGHEAGDAFAMPIVREAASRR
jgi:predicted MFS family arabinose efflux permease